MDKLAELVNFMKNCKSTGKFDFIFEAAWEMAEICEMDFNDAYHIVEHEVEKFIEGGNDFHDFNWRKDCDEEFVAEWMNLGDWEFVERYLSEEDAA